MILIDPAIRLGIRHFRNSRSIRNQVEEHSKQLTSPFLFLKSKYVDRFVSDPIIYFDIGARFGPQNFDINLYGLMHFVACDADPDENSNLYLDFQKTKFTIISNAIAGTNGERTLYLTNKLACSSLLPPEGHSLALRGGSLRNLDRFKIKKEVQIMTKTLKDSLPIEFKNIDILKVDVQGLEFEILTGLGLIRPFLISAECSTVEIYKGQKTFFSVGLLLEELGYMPLKFMEIQLVPNTLADYQSCIPVHGDVIFVPDNSTNGRAIIERDVEKWFASLCMHGYMDFALWQIEELKIPKPTLVTQTEELLKNS